MHVHSGLDRLQGGARSRYTQVHLGILAREISMRDGTEAGRLTVGVPHLAQEPHRRGRQWVVLREFQLGREDAPLEGRPLRALDKSFPVEEIVFGHGAGSDAFWGVVCEIAVFLKEAALSSSGRHVDSGCYVLDLCLLCGGRYKKQRGQPEKVASVSERKDTTAPPGILPRHHHGKLVSTSHLFPLSILITKLMIAELLAAKYYILLIEIPSYI